MAQVFTLQLIDNVETTVDFISTSFRVQDGGFDITLPRQSRNFAVLRPGPFFMPTDTPEMHRECTIRFEARGATKTAILANLNRIERMLRAVYSRKRIGAGRRAELKYAWDGATNATFFEVLGGELSLSTDHLSVEKMFATEVDGTMVLPDITLTLYLNPYGYGISPLTGTMTEVPLNNPSVGGKQTGGVAIKNPYTGNNHYVEIAAVDLPGAQPYLTRIELAYNATGYSWWSDMYIGLRASPFPSEIILENDSIDYSSIGAGTTTANAGASNGSYRTQSLSSGDWLVDFEPQLAWYIDPSTTRGTFQTFFHAWNQMTGSVYWATGVTDYTVQGYNYVTNFVKSDTNKSLLPLGVIQLPPGLDIGAESNPYNSWVGLYRNNLDIGAVPFTLDFMSLLPIDSALRIWKTRIAGSTNLQGTFVDDGFKGLLYMIRSADSKKALPLYGLLEPIKLEPNTLQRLYFTSVGNESGGGDGSRGFTVRVYVAPTYSMLAL